MPVWLPPTDEEQPEASLVFWGAFEVLVPKLGAPTIRVVGVRAQSGEGRLSSPVAKVDAPNPSVVTSTGHVYRLVGEPGVQGDADYVWRRWVFSWRAEVLGDAAPALLHQSTSRRHPMATTSREP